jgi:predicted ferric reductase
MSQLWWHTARAGGIVAWGLMAASVLWGLALSTKVTNGKPRPNWLLDMHRFLGAAALVFTGIHVTSIMLDSYVHFGPTEVLVPFTGNWHPLAVAWGIVSMYLLAAVEVTSLLRRRISKRVWRSVHFASFGVFVFSTIHLLTAGTDRSEPVLQGAVYATIAATAALTILRVRQATGPGHSASVSKPRISLGEAR